MTMNKRAAPLLMITIKSSMMELGLTESAYAAVLSMFQVEPIATDGSHSSMHITEKDQAKLIREITRCRDNRNLFIPVWFAAEEIGLSRDDYAQKAEDLNIKIESIFGIHYILKRNYIEMGGKALASEEENDEHHESVYAEMEDF